MNLSDYDIRKPEELIQNAYGLIETIEETISHTPTNDENYEMYEGWLCLIRDCFFKPKLNMMGNFQGEDDIPF